MFGSDYGWAILDANGERVLTGTAPSRVAAVFAAERARLQIREAEKPKLRHPESYCEPTRHFLR
jgi:hypothetical protein